MKNNHSLNNHSIQELAQAVDEFLKGKELDTEILVMDEKHYIVKANKYGNGLLDKTLGEDISCTVELIENAANVVFVQAGDGKWLGKVTGAAVATGAVLLGPVGWLAGVATLCTAGAVGRNIYKQASLPTDVDRFIYEFLNKSNKAEKVQAV